MRIALVAGLMMVVAAGALAGPAARLEVQGVELVLSTDKEAYSPGEPVEVELAVRNPRSNPVTFQFADSQRYDFLVLREDGRLVWRWSHDKVFAQVLGTLTLEPGQELRYRARWAQVDQEGRRVPAGRYWVLGVFPPQRPIPPTPLDLRAPRVAITVGGAAADSPVAYRKVFRPGRVRVRFFAWAGEREVRRLLRSLNLRVERADPLGYVVARVGGQEVWSVAEALNRSPLVEWAVPDYVLVPRRP